MDRGEHRDLLSSGVFDGSRDRLYNKRLMAGDSSRKRERERYCFHSDAFSHTGVMFGSPRNTGHVCHLDPQTDQFTSYITALNKKERFDLILLLSVKCDIQ